MTPSISNSVTPTPAVPAVNTPLLPNVIPSPDPVDPASLLAAILATIHRHVIIDSAQAIAVTLWIAMTWFMTSIHVAPLLIITAPERACGKSQLLSLLLRLVFRGLSAANTSAAFLFRVLEAWQPTILFDEVDTFLRDNPEIKGMLNAGHTRESAYVGRTVAKDGDYEPTLFCVWGAKALAGIAVEKHLPDSTMSRSIVALMRRKLPGEDIVRLRYTDSGHFDELASQLARFSQDYSAQVFNARPNLPDELSDRAQDNWEPLLAIAECAGPEWSAKAVAAALILSKSSDESVSSGNELLADIQEAFAARRCDKIRSADLIQILVADTESPWPTYNRGQPLTPRQLSKQLGAYGIKPKTVRMGSKETPKGYELAQFTDAFARYLAPQCNAAPEAFPAMAVSDVDATGGKRNKVPTRPDRIAVLGDESPEVIAAIRVLNPNYGVSPAPSADEPQMPFDKRPDSDF